MPRGNRRANIRGLPTLEAFRSATAPNGVFKRRGSNMAKIDAALEHYWDNYAGADVDGRIVLLYLLAKECRRWLKMKEGKTSSLSVSRRVQIKDLGETAMGMIWALSPEVGRAYQVFENRKERLDGNAIGPLKGLSQGYHFERQFYLDHQKTHALSGSEMSNFTLYNAARMKKKELNSKLKKIAGKEFENISYNEFKALGKLNHGVEVAYLNKIRRMPHWVHVKEGKFYDIYDHLIDMDIVRHRYVEPMPYAMDHYGNLFVHTTLRDPHESGYHQRWFNHSSFMAGREVICAGCLVIRNGLLIFIDNSSGHYKPTTENLLACVKFLDEEEDADLSNSSVVDFSRGNLPKEYHFQTFVDSNGLGQPDWTEADDLRVGRKTPA